MSVVTAGSRFFDRDSRVCAAMATPIKSPVQKKHREDATPDDEDLQITSVSKGGVTLNAIQQLLDRKLDPTHQFLQQISLDLKAFKVRMEFEGMGLRVAEAENQISNSMARVVELEQQLGKMKATLEQSPRREPGNPRYLSVVVGNIPNASSLDEAKDWLDKHCRSCGIDPPSPSDVYVKGSYSNLIFLKCQTESHRDRLIQSI